MLGEAQDRISVADQAIKMLAAVDPGNADTPQSALAAYCAAAGEAFRLGRTGNPYQARSLLEDALRHAEAAGSAPLMALSAYRLALVSGDGSSGGQSGGAGRGLRRSVARRAP